jgi:hypothetical protein
VLTGEKGDVVIDDDKGKTLKRESLMKVWEVG